MPKKNELLTIGYQHTTASELLLDYFNASEEMGWDGDVTSHCSLPDYLATVGKVTAEFFNRNERAAFSIAAAFGSIVCAGTNSIEGPY